MKRTPLKRKTPMRRKPKPKLVGEVMDWGAPFSSFKIVKHKHGPFGSPFPLRKPLPKQSLKRKQERLVYEREVGIWWEGHDHRCECYLFTDGTLARRDGTDPGSKRCRRAASNRPHHAAKRGRNYTNRATFMGACDACHIPKIHANENKARRLGYLINPKTLLPYSL